MSYIMDRIASHGLNDVMEIDHVIAVHADGTITDGIPNVYAPDLMHVEGEGPTVGTEDIENVGGGDWTYLTGFTGQHGYNGAVLHSSEFVGGGLETYILANPGLYVATVVNCWPEPECQGHESLRGDLMGAEFYCDGSCGGTSDDFPEPAGWAVAYMPLPVGV